MTNEELMEAFLKSYRIFYTATASEREYNYHEDLVFILKEEILKRMKGGRDDS